jgi:O-antigen ligase
MSKSFIFHETAKYVIALICIIGIIRMRRARIPGAALLYIALLIPSIVITYYSFGFDSFRRSVLFSLSAPLAIVAAVSFFANLELDGRDLQKSIIALTLPIMGVAGITAISTYWRESIHFTTEANFVTSGGFGPNQVASGLAFGALVLILAAITSGHDSKLRVAMILIACILIIQSAMTFSRGGITASLLSLLAVSPFIAMTKRQKAYVAVAAIIIALVLPVVFVRLNRLTDGKLGKRFSSTEMTGRETLMQVDLLLWEKNPVFGVGVGISKYAHSGFQASHTEFTRAVAESGTLGAVAYIGLGFLCLRRALAVALRRSDPHRPILLAMMVWPWLYMSVNAGRTAAPALALGMAFVSVVLPSQIGRRAN